DSFIFVHPKAALPPQRRNSPIFGAEVGGSRLSDEKREGLLIAIHASSLTITSAILVVPRRCARGSSEGVRSAEVGEDPTTIINAQPSSAVEMVVIDFVYHHGGQFVTKDDGEMVYEMGEIDVEEKLDVDTLDVFSMRDHYQALGYDKIVECWWLVLGRPLRSGRRVFDTDDELLELCFYAERNGNKIHLYYEHAVSIPNLVEDPS
ncbi:hypothetical protein PIB30_094240, partial [Stylosanthes scabra]|nr:hypothetical protein [Stylosanthes scabra]